MTDLADRLVRMLREAVPQPPHTLDPGGMRAGDSRRAHRRRVLAPALAAAAVVAVAVGVLLAVHQPGGQRDADRATGSVSPRDTTEQVVARLLAGAPTVPGARAVDNSPTDALDQPMEEPASPSLIRRTDLWTAPGTTGAALEYIRSHLSPGFTPNGSSSWGGTGPAVQGLSFDASGRRWQRSGLYTGLELLVSVTPFGGGVAIRVDAEAMWLPQRGVDQRIPLSVGSVNVVVDRYDSAPTVHRTLGAANARSLAATVNHLAMYPPVVRHCPMDRGFTDTLIFHAVRADIVVRADVDGCSSVTVRVNGHQSGPTLQGGGAFDQAVTRVLGLPREYGK
jgi:hypothetical protein